MFHVKPVRTCSGESVVAEDGPHAGSHGQHCAEERCPRHRSEAADAKESDPGTGKGSAPEGALPFQMTELGC